MEQGGGEEAKRENNVYLYFVLREHFCRVKLVLEPKVDDGEEKSPPPIDTLLYFHDKGLPVGMGAFAVGSKLYLIGGEILKKGHHLEPDNAVSCHSIFKALSNRVFLYDHDYRPDPKIKQVSSMNSPKPCPQVALLDDKIYVLSGMQYSDMRAPRSPKFECYDLTEKIWKVLSDPPFYFKDSATYYLHLSLIGRQIVVRCQMGVWFYDVDDCTWTGIHADGSLFEFFGRVADKSEEGIIVIYTINGVVAYLDDNLKYGQVLKDLTPYIPVANMTTQAAFVSYLGERMFCLFLSETDLGWWDMHIIIFRLEMLKNEEEEQKHEGEERKDFCRVVVLRHQIYDASKDITSDQFHPTHAFIVREGFDKHGLDCFGAAEGKVGVHRGNNSNGGSKTSISAKRNRKKKERKKERQLWAKGWTIEASLTEVVPKSERLNISSNPSTVTCASSSSAPLGNDLYSIDEEIENLKRQIQILKPKLGPNEEEMEIWERLYKELILLEHENTEVPL